MHLFSYNILTPSVADTGLDFLSVPRYNKNTLRGAGPIRLRLSENGALTREPDTDHAVVGKGCLLLWNADGVRPSGIFFRGDKQT